MSRIRRRAIAGIGAGEVFEITRTFTRADIDRFGELTRDYNPEHYTNQRGELVLGAELTGQLPRGEASHVLRAMVDGGDPTIPCATRMGRHRFRSRSSFDIVLDP